MENSKYYIGLDIGTSSVGFCVTDENYNVINKKENDLWGVVLFDEAKTAKERRAKRSARRSVQRQKERLMLLRSLFEEEINKVDSNFFIRLKASSLWEDDKQSVGIFSRNSLFFDDKINDKTFFKKYPTIYHLRNACVENPAEDIRFLYLAIHNLLKHRGNFLSESFNTENLDLASLDVLFTNLQNEIVGDLDDSEFNFLSFNTANQLTEKQKTELKKLDDELSKNHLKVGVLAEKLKTILNCTNQNQIALVKAISGGVVNAKSIFSNKNNEYEIDCKIDGFDVADETFEQFIIDVTELSEQAGSILMQAKAIFDRITFKKILGENTYFCSAMVDKFNLHKKQLRNFKDAILELYPEKYNEMFKVHDFKINNYAKFIDGSNYYATKKEIASKCSRADFYKYVKSVLSSNAEAFNTERIQSIYQLIEEDNFLPKLRTSANSVIPYQINKRELEKILTMAKSKYEFLNNKDENGLTIADKIISIFEFKIPYFVGPLSKKNSKNAWIEKRLDEKVFPWNIEQVVDYDKCEMEFIKRMQNNCSYLSGEMVLPKCSLLYAEYMVLQELNNLRINGQKLQREIKEKLLDYIKENGTITISNIKSFLNQNGYFANNEKINISGIQDNKFLSNLNIYKNFNKILDGQIEKYRMQVEDIIFHATYMSDKNRFEKWLNKNYSNFLNNKQIKAIKGLKISDWGKFSKKFLDGILGVDVRTGEVRTIIQIMREEPLNLMEILALYEFDALNVKQLDKDEIEYEDIQQLYCSPAVKRGTWQSVKIVKEIEKIMGAKPTKIFIEVTRASIDKLKGRTTDTRKNKVVQCYKKLRDEVVFDPDIKKLKEELGKELSLDGKKLYLYFTQMGKCMYSGESIDIKSLILNDCDIDHIFPQSVIKDDSFDNLVLVKRKENIDKSNDVISPKIQSKMKDFWQYLKNNDLISNEKLSRLLRTNSLTELEKKDFVARQMVITNQSAKAVIDLFKSIYGPEKVVYSKAKNVTMFRNCEFKFERDKNVEDTEFGKKLKQSLIKCREMNDFHHAKDAYLNIFVGNVFDEKYSKRFYLKDTFKYGFNLNNAFLKDMPGVLDKVNNLATIEKTMNSNTPKVGFIAREVTGQFYKETIYGTIKHQKDFNNLDEIKKLKQDDRWNGGNIPLKSLTNPLSVTAKYGHLSDGKYSYYTLIEYNKKGTRSIRFVEIPYIYAKNITNIKELKTAIKKIVDFDEFNILIEKVKPGTIFKIGCGYFKLAGNTGDSLKLHNFNQLYLPSKLNEYFKMFSKIVKQINTKKDLIFDGENLVVAQNRFGEKSLLTKEQNLQLYKKLVKHLSKPMYKYVSLGKLGEKLTSSYEKFNNLDIVQQVKTLSELLDIINGVNGGDLTSVGEKAHCGTLSINKSPTGIPLSIIYSSSTGFYKKEIRLI